MTRRKLKELLEMAGIVTAAVVVVVGTFLIIIEVSGRLALRGDEAKIVVRPRADRMTVRPAEIEKASAMPALVARSANEVPGR